MDNLLKYIDYLSHYKIRGSFISDNIAFVLSKNSQEILWLTQKAVLFFGFDTLENALQQEKHFNFNICSKIEDAFENKTNIQLKGKNIYQDKILNFIADDIYIPSFDDRFYFVKAKDIKGVSKPDILLQGFETPNICAAFINDNGIIIAKTANYNHLDFEEGFFVSLDNAQVVKTTLQHNNQLCDVHCIKLNEVGGTLVLAQPASTVTLFIQNDKSKKLSDVERLAFREIAERLRNDLQPIEKGVESFVPNIIDLPIEEDKDKSQYYQTSSKLIADETTYDAISADKISDKTMTDILSLISKPYEGGLPQDTAYKNNKNDFVLKPSSLYNLLDTATDGVVWLDHQGKIRHLSAAATALTGYESQKLLGCPFTLFFDDQSQEKIANYVQNFIKSSVTSLFSKGEYGECVTSHGATIPLFVTLVPLSSGEGFAVLLKDMSNVLLDKTFNYQHIVLSETLHEIRTPLSALLGFAEIMQEGHFGAVENPRYQRYIRDIILSARHILTLVNRFLEKAKLQHEKSAEITQPNIEAYNIITVLKDCVRLFEKNIEESGINLRIIAPKTLPAILVDEQELRQIIINLLSNAIRFTKENGKIIIYGAKLDDRRVKISVSDNGIGMTEEEMAKALLPFGQILRDDKGIKKKSPKNKANKNPQKNDGAYKGTGLGLPTTKKMVENNGGQFILLSKPNQGTTIEMSFPLFTKKPNL